MIDNNTLLQSLNAKYEKYISILEEVCNLESPSSNKQRVDAVGTFFATMANAHGWDVEIFKQENAGDVVCITVGGEIKEQPIVFSGHIDTVFPVGAFGTPAVRRDNEKIYGPGVVDCKGGVVAAFYAIDVLEECGFKKRPIMLLLQTDEETNSSQSNNQTIKYICEKSKNAIAFLNMEGNTLGEMCLVRKGIMTVSFTITGKEAHSSKCATEGASAILDAAYKIIELEKFKDAKGITCCCSVIDGGSVPNSVPEKCSFKANFRFATQEQLEYIKSFVENLSNQSHVPGCRCAFEYAEIRPAMEMNQKNKALFDKINTIFLKNDLPVLNIGVRTGGSDAAYVTAFGIPCIDSIGTRGGNIHTKDEFAFLESLKDSARRLVFIARDI